MNVATKRRNADATRQQILNSARAVFTEKGYAGAGLREICSKAGVDPALVKRYFGSKQQLFTAVFATADGIARLLQGPVEHLGFRLADYFMRKPDGDSSFDPTIALLKSIGSQEVNQHVKDILQQQFIDLLAGHIGGPDARQRAAIIISQLLGFDVLRRVLAVNALGSRHRKMVVETWGAQMQQLIDG